MKLNKKLAKQTKSKPKRTRGKRKQTRSRKEKVTKEEDEEKEEENKVDTFDDIKPEVNIIVNTEIQINEECNKSTPSQEKKLRGKYKKRKNKNEIRLAAKEKANRIALLRKEDQQIKEVFNMKCDICSFEFDKFRNIHAHYLSEHNTRGYLICCDQKYYTRTNVLDHALTHINPESLKYGIKYILQRLIIN